MPAPSPPLPVQTRSSPAPIHPPTLPLPLPVLTRPLPLLLPPPPPCREVIQALEVAQKAPKPPLSAMFEDVYAEMPWHLAAQQAEVFAHVAAHPDACPSDIPLK